MASNADLIDQTNVLSSKRAATSYQILAVIAEEQPAVNQQEIAEEIGVTAQAVSGYLRDLLDEGFVEKRGRGRYEITNEGVDWLIPRTNALQSFIDHISEDVLSQVDMETALATEDIDQGDSISLRMVDGLLRAAPGETGSATAVAVTDAAAGTEVGFSNVEGIIEYDFGRVTVAPLPSIRNGGSGAIDTDSVADLGSDCELVAVDAPEGVAAARKAGLDIDIRFGTGPSVREATSKGLDVFLLVSDPTEYTSTFRENSIAYEVVDLERNQ